MAEWRPTRLAYRLWCIRRRLSNVTTDMLVRPTTMRVLNPMQAYANYFKVFKDNTFIGRPSN